MVILTIENQYRYTGHHTCHDRSPVCQITTPAARMQGLVRVYYAAFAVCVWYVSK